MFPENDDNYDGPANIYNIDSHQLFYNKNDGEFYNSYDISNVIFTTVTANQYFTTIILIRHFTFPTIVQIKFTATKMMPMNYTKECFIQKKKFSLDQFTVANEV